MQAPAQRLCFKCGNHVSGDARFCASCGSSVLPSGERPNDPLIGQMIAGQYLVKHVIGLGGMGRVYQAEQSSLGRSVAIKVIHPHLLHDEQSVARFYTEARATSRLNHPNSVSVIDFGRTDTGILYLVMEFLEGRDLGHIIEQEGPLTINKSLEIADGVLAALDEAHALGVVHRDLKPENIILKRQRDGAELVKVVDFGLASVAGLYKTSITQPGLICGTPDYMSPEQGRGEIVDGRGDIYALGVVLFELLTDRLPYIDDTPTKLMLRHIHDPIPSPIDIAPHRGISDALAKMVMRAMAKSRDERYQTAQAMRVALKEVILELRREAQATREIKCVSCGTLNVADSRFCKTCGAPVIAASNPNIVTTQIPPRSSNLPDPDSELTLIGRENALQALHAVRADLSETTRWARVTGPSGVGKTRLLRVFADRMRSADDVVVWSTPHPSGALVPYYPLLTWCLGLVDGPDVSAFDQIEGLSPIQAAGLEELKHAKGHGSVELGSRSAAVGEFLLELIRRRLEAVTGDKHVVLVLDDAHRIDGLSRQTLEHLSLSIRSMPVVVIEALDTASQGISLPGAQVIELAPLRVAEVATLFPEIAMDIGFEQHGEQRVLPLLLEQLHLLRVSITPTNLTKTKPSDAVMQRLEQLEFRALRLLQAISVLGDSCRASALGQMVDADTLSTLEELVTKRWVIVDDTRLTMVHPWIRAVIEASIPVQARKQLHDKAMQLAEYQAQLETRVEHAWRGTDPTTAMLLMERFGIRSLDRADVSSAVIAFRRGLEIARRELLERGDESLDAAIVGFSLRLAQSMLFSGDALAAEGVLREVLDLTPPDSTDRKKMYALLAENYFRRDRFADAIRQSLLIIESGPIAPSNLQADAWAVIARSRAALGDTAEALEAYKHALELLQSSNTLPMKASKLAIELAEWFADSGHTDQAQVQFEMAKDYAAKANIHVLLAAAEGGLGTIDELHGQQENAVARYRLAVHHAGLAGDALAVKRWQHAVQQLSRGSQRSVASGSEQRNR